jgi:hypothetical protein
MDTEGTRLRRFREDTHWISTTDFPCRWQRSDLGFEELAAKDLSFGSEGDFCGAHWGCTHGSLRTTIL